MSKLTIALTATIGVITIVVVLMGLVKNQEEISKSAKSLEAEIDSLRKEKAVVIHEVIPPDDLILQPLTLEQFAALQEQLRKEIAEREALEARLEEEAEEERLRIQEQQKEIQRLLEVQPEVEVIDNVEDSSTMGSESSAVLSVEDDSDVEEDSGSGESGDDGEGLRAKVTVTSPTFICPACMRLKAEYERKKSDDLPFDIVFQTSNNFPHWPYIEMTKPDGSIVKWSQKHPSTITEMLRVYHILWDKKTVAKANKETSFKGLGPGELKDRISGYGTWLPTNGTVVGKTVKEHLLDEHGFEEWQLEGLTDEMLHSLHQIVHDKTDGRTTAVMPAPVFQPSTQSRTSSMNNNGSWSWSSDGGYKTNDQPMRFRRGRNR